MAKKITINPVQAGNGLETAINLRLQQIEDAFNDNVLWRSGAGLNPNSMALDLDMAENDILNLLELTLGSVNVKADILQAQTDIDDLKTSVNILWPDDSPPFPGFNIKWGTIEGTLTDQTDLKAWLDRIAVNETDIAANTANISTNTANIATNTANISTNTADIATNTANIATNTANITTNTADIATNTADIATNTADIATKEDSTSVVADPGPAHVLDTDTTYTTAGAKLLSLKNNGTEKWSVDKDGNINMLSTAKYVHPAFSILTFETGTANIQITPFTGNFAITNSTNIALFLVNGNGISISNGTSKYVSPNAANFDLGYPSASGAWKDLLMLGNINFRNTTTNQKVTSYITDGATATAFTVDSLNALSTAGAKILALQNNGVEKFSVDKDGQASTVAAAPTATSHLTRKDYVDSAIAAIPGGINPNVIINGNFDIWQRGTSFTAPATGTVTADRFRFQHSGAVVADVLRETDVPTYAESGVKSNYSLVADITTADTSIAASDYCHFVYKVEGFDYQRIAGGNAVLSFWVKGAKTGIHCVAFLNSGSDRSYVTEYTIDAADTWEKKSVTVPLTETGGTWDYTNGVGLKIFFSLSAGSTYQTTADAWQTGSYFATSSQVNETDSATNFFHLAQIKLEKGTVATEFQPRPYALELDLCARYFQKSYEINTAPGTTVSTGAITYRATNAGGHNFDGMWQAFYTELRASPTVTWYSSNSGLTGKVYDASAAADVTISAVAYTSKKRTGNPSGAPAAAGNYLLGHWTADAEL